jgi:hypothetical protein
MNDNFTVFYIVFGIIALMLSFFLIRWVLGIDRQIKNQKAMIALLIKLCRQQDVPEDQLEEVKSKFDLN